MINFDYITDDECLSNLIEFKKEDICEVFTYIGFEIEELVCKEESMSRYIFLQGDEHEVYTSAERSFVESIDYIFIFETFYKNTKRGKIPCRIIAAELDEDNEIYNSVFFIKEINKAIDGFNIFFIKAGCSFYFGMRSYDTSRTEDFMLSKPMTLCKEFEEISDKLSYINSSTEFIDFYNSLSSVMELSTDDELLYDAYNKNQDELSRYGLLLNEVGSIYHIDFSEEIERFYNSLEKDTVVSFKSLLDDASEELRFIKSNKVNTMEMLFEADELARLAQKAEDEHNAIVEKNEDINVNECNEDIKEYLSDPETMIKLLKKRKGL